MFDISRIPYIFWGINAGFMNEMINSRSVFLPLTFRKKRSKMRKTNIPVHRIQMPAGEYSKRFGGTITWR